MKLYQLTAVHFPLLNDVFAKILVGALSCICLAPNEVKALVGVVPVVVVVVAALNP